MPDSALCLHHCAIDQRLPVVGVDLGGTNLRVGLLADDQVLWKRSLPTEAWRGKDFVMANMFGLIAEAIAFGLEAEQPAVGIGIGLPCPVNPAIGIVDSPANLPGWDQVPLADLLRAQFELPIYLNNDANAAALGEWLYGAGRGYDHLAYVTISTGIGGGVISDGRLLLGRDGGAAEIGHMCIQAQNGAVCDCGRRGCLEAYASGTAMVRHAKQLLSDGQISLLAPGSEISPREIAVAAARGDRVAQAVLTRSRHYLAVGLANVLTLYNPQLLILGGGLTNLWTELIEPALACMAGFTFPAAARQLCVVKPVLGADSGLVGAAASAVYGRRIR